MGGNDVTLYRPPGVRYFEVGLKSSLSSSLSDSGITIVDVFLESGVTINTVKLQYSKSLSIKGNII
jgi:hypothetical protein